MDYKKTPNSNIRWNEHAKAFGRKRSKVKKTFLSILAACFLFFGIAAVAFTIFFATTIRDLPDPNNISTRTVAQSTKIYDRSGTHLLYEFHGAQKRTVVNLDQISSAAINATIAIEDKNFYTHKGYRFTSMIRAVLTNILKAAKVQGGSTITQQLVKNAVLTNEKSLGRKIREIILSSEIERRFTKDEILKLYLNQIPYGSVAYGIEAASQTFFGKSAKDLDLAEGALLAAVIQSPTRYSPYGNHRDELVARWKFVLGLMQEQGFATEGQVSDAKAVDIMKRIKPKRESISAPHFVFYVRDLLSESYGEREVETGGLKVITSLDWDKQVAAEKAVTDGIAAIEKAGGSNAALVSLEPSTGQIMAMVGSRDYFDVEHDGAVNVVLRSRQPGSSFKPIVYAASFIKGYTPSTVLYDVNTSFPTPQGPYSPKDYDGKERGPVTIRQALAGSLNTPAVKMIYLTGIDHVLDLADQLGYSTLSNRSRFGLSLVLGGGEVKLLEHASAFGTFATEGVKHKPVAILKVEDASGKTLEEWKQDEGERVIDAEVVRNLTDILQDNAARAYIFGEKNYLTLPDRQVAAKTGTTNDFHDAWAVGYTPQLVTGVWTGNNSNKEMKKGADGSKIAAPIWNAYMKAALKGAPVMPFTAPQPIVTGKPILDGQTMPEVRVTIDKLSGKLATEFTPPSLREERVYREVHDVLRYVDKDDPRGAVPADPAKDPMYKPWEEAVTRWATQNNINAATPPTEYDTIHQPGNIPTVSWVSPSNGNAIQNRTVNLEATASATRGVSRVEFSIDGQYLGRLTSSPYRLTVTLPANLERGFHTLTATAYDDQDATGFASITISTSFDPGTPAVRWQSPANGSVIAAFPLPLFVSLHVGDVRAVRFYAQKGAGPITEIGTIIPDSGAASLNWVIKPAAGTWHLWAEILHNDNTTEPGEKISVIVQ